MTPLVGALAWAALGGPRSGLLNQLWYAVGGREPLINLYSPGGIARVMALFEESVAFVMISAAMKSMDPALEESSIVVLGGSFHGSGLLRPKAKGGPTKIRHPGGLG